MRKNENEIRYLLVIRCPHHEKRESSIRRKSQLASVVFVYRVVSGRNEGGARTWSIDSRDIAVGNLLWVDSIREE